MNALRVEQAQLQHVKQALLTTSIEHLTPEIASSIINMASTNPILKSTIQRMKLEQSRELSVLEQQRIALLGKYTAEKRAIMLT